MARKMMLLVLFCALFASNCTPNRTAPEADRAMRLWLSRDCESGEKERLAALLRQHGAALEGPLIQAFLSGPPAEEVDKTIEVERRRHLAVRRAIDAGRLSGLEKERIAAIRSVPIEQRLARAREDYIDAYRSTALTGLAVIGRGKGLDLLRKVAADARSPYRDVAKTALESPGR